MARHDLDLQLAKIDRLIAEIENFIPEGTHGSTGFRADLAGLLVVAIASAYETCVKDVLISHASSKHGDFEYFITQNFAKLNSRIAKEDLFRYAKLFSSKIHDDFKFLLNKRSGAIERRTGMRITETYGQILSWRHDYAHAGIQNTTVSEAARFHRFAKRVLYCFDEAFCGKSP
jgi:hypothetical protein